MDGRKQADNLHEQVVALTYSPSVWQKLIKLIKETQILVDKYDVTIYNVDLASNLSMSIDGEGLERDFEIVRDSLRDNLLNMPRFLVK